MFLVFNGTAMRRLIGDDSKGRNNQFLTYIWTYLQAGSGSLTFR
jgi:hypothetical protein